MCWICWVPEEAAPTSKDKSLSLWRHHFTHVRMYITHFSDYALDIMVSQDWLTTLDIGWATGANSE